MKRCPKCRRDYYDDSLLYCLDDGSALLDGPATIDEPATAILPPGGRIVSEAATRIFKTDPQAGTVSMSGYLPNSIAVLPFAHLTNDPDDEYFCDGLAEELINALSRVDDLKVVARTSAFAFKGKNIDIAQIGSILNVSNIVEGSVRKFGERMRINVQLINTADGYNVWSDKYDTEMRDLFDVQDEITLAVVNALKSKLLNKPDRSDQMSSLLEELKQHAQDVEAYQLYLKGRFQWSRRTPESLKQAAEFFDQAIVKDTNYALAHSALAETYVLYPNYGVSPPLDYVRALWACALPHPGFLRAHGSLHAGRDRDRACRT